MIHIVVVQKGNAISHFPWSQYNVFNILENNGWTSGRNFSISVQLPLNWGKFAPPTIAPHSLTIPIHYVTKAIADCMFMFNSVRNTACLTKSYISNACIAYIVQVKYSSFSQRVYSNQRQHFVHKFLFFFMFSFVAVVGLCVLFFRELTQFHFYYKIYVCLPFPICAMAGTEYTCFKMVYCGWFFHIVSGSDGFWTILISIERVITGIRVDLNAYLWFSFRLLLVVQHPFYSNFGYSFALAQRSVSLFRILCSNTSPLSPPNENQELKSFHQCHKILCCYMNFIISCSHIVT